MAAILNVDIHVNDDGSLAIRKVSEEAKKAESSTKDLKKSTDNLGSSFTSLSNTMKTAGFAFLAYEAINLGKASIAIADNMTIVDSRLKLVTKSIEEQTKTHKELFSIAQQTRLGFKETADLYSRIAISTKDYNISQEKLLSITGTINKAMIVSGGTAESMNYAIMQLGQAFSSNFKSVGQELGSIREQTPALYQAIVAGSGMTSEAFRKAAEDGELSTEIIIKALEKQANIVDRDFEKIGKTVGQSMTNMSNSIMGFVGYIDKSTGASSSLSESITSVSLGIDDFTKSLKESNNSLETFLHFGAKVHPVLYLLSEAGNVKLEKDGILASILKVNQGAGEALYKVLAETIGIVDKTAGEWSKIIDSSYSGMGKWVESVGMSLGIVEEKAKATKKAIDGVVPSRPTADNYTLVDDLNDRFSRSTEKTKKQLEDEFDDLKKIEDEKLKAQEKAQQDSDKLSEEWGKRKTDLSYSIAEAEQDAFSKPYIELEKKYQEDLEKYGKLKGAKELLTKEYQAKTEALNKETSEKFNKQEEEKNKKSAEWQVKLFEANEKINDQFITQQEKMYGSTSSAQIESWYQNQLEWLGKLSLEGKATSQELQALLDKINGLKELKLKEQTISFKLEKSFYTSVGSGLTNTIEDAFNGDNLNLKSFFSNIKRGLTNTIAGDFSSGIVNNFKAYGGFGGAASLIGTSLSASDVSSIAGLSGSTITGGMIKTSGGTLIDQASGTVTAQGSDAMSILSMASSAKTIYGALTDGISGSVLSGFNGVGNFLGNAGFETLGSGISQFGAGFSSPLSFAAESPLAGLYGSGIGSSASASTMAGGMLSSGLIGYGIGSLGDAIFGAQTKAGIGGAAGAAIGSIIPGIGTIIGGIIGSVLGGFFGSTKQTGAGIDILGNASADSANGQYWQSYKKKSWFSSKSWTNTTGFGEAENQAIMQTIGIYDTLLSQLGEYNDLIVVGGRFSNLQEFLDTNVVKSFLTAINPQNLEEIYKSWTDYAAKIDSTITEALATAVSGYTTYGRGFTEWKLGSGTTDQLKFTADYLQKDFTALASSLGANGVTVDNFLAKYDEAIKANFTQDTITAWASLGDTLMKSTDATVKYKEALDQLNGTTTYSLPVDTMLAKVNNSSSAIDIKQLVTTQTNQNDSVIGLLVQSVKALQEILRVSQFGKTIV